MNSFFSRTAIAGSFALASLAVHAQTYTYQKFSAGPQFFTFALDISNSGEVVGYDTDYATKVNGFVEQNGTLMNVSVNGSKDVTLTAIQGNTLYGTENGLGFSMNAQGTVTLLKLPSGPSAIPSGVNGKGVIVGTYQTQSGTSSFIRQNGTYTTYSYPGAAITSFRAINSKGAIVGTWNNQGTKLQSFELVNGKLSTIAYPGAYSTIATGINDSGEIVGWYYVTSNGPLALFRYDGTTYTNIPTPANSYACTAGHVNNSGDFVGSCADSITGMDFGFVATPSENTEIVLPAQ